MSSRSPKSVTAGRISGPVFLRLALCLDCLAISLWGIWVCRALVRSAVAGPYGGPNRLVGIVGWLVLFAPFAALGGYGLMRTWQHLRHDWAELCSSQPVKIIPPEHCAPAQSTQFVARTNRPDRAITQPLDDATRQHLDQLAARAARIIGIVAGMFFLLSGSTGFFLGWLQAHRPSDTFTPLHSGIAEFRVTVYFLVGCGLSVLVGCFILREIFARPRNKWLVPLQAFTAIVGHKLSAEEQLRGK